MTGESRILSSLPLRPAMLRVKTKLNGKRNLSKWDKRPLPRQVR